VDEENRLLVAIEDALVPDQPEPGESGLGEAVQAVGCLIEHDEVAHSILHARRTMHDAEENVVGEGEETQRGGVVHRRSLSTDLRQGSPSERDSLGWRGGFGWWLWPLLGFPRSMP